MDLGAYAQIENLGKLMADNGIEVPRLRGIRWMGNEEPISKENIAKEAKDIGLYECESACESGFVWDPFCFTISKATRRLKRKYLIYDGHKIVDIRWSAVHGKKRKLFKYNLKMAKRRVEANLHGFNSYAGRKDILYIHARIGGGNWPHYRAEVEHQPWFILKVDDPFDSTYCDIYAQIKVPEEVTT